jgi:pimeloyl-ACP methyl ester carboxylesterase
MTGPELETQSVTAGETRFLLRETGEGTGTPVLLLHGVPETSSVWGTVAPALAQGRRVLAPDLPGLGGSAYTGPYDMASVVTQVLALLDQQVPSGPVDVVGHDWGGVVALGLAGRHPDRVRRLCVVNAPYGRINLLKAPHIPLFALPAVPELAFRAAGARLIDLMLSLGWKAGTTLDEDRRAEYIAAYADPERVTAMLGYYREAARPHLTHALRLGAAPDLPPVVRADRMLVLWGAADPVLPLSVGEAVVKALGSDCTMVSIPGAGHFLIDEAPELVTQTLLEFLADSPVVPTTSKRAPRKAKPPEPA